MSAAVSPRPRPRRQVALLLPLLLLLLVGASGCGPNGTGDKGYIEGDGVITEVPVAHRQAVGPIVGRTLTGTRVDLAQDRGKVVVMNLWWSQCPPCRAEAPTLAAAAKVLQPKGVVFLGINSRDASRSGPLAYQRAYRVPYPSIYDPDGQTLLAFRGAVSPTAIPSTVVIDRHGRIAATVLGALGSKQTLYDLVHDAGGPPAPRAS